MNGQNVIHKAQNTDSRVCFILSYFHLKLSYQSLSILPLDSSTRPQIDWKTGWNKFTLQGQELSCINFTKILC